MLKKKYTKKIWRTIDAAVLITIIFPAQLFYSTPAIASQDAKIQICHYPQGNEENPETLEISPFAWPAHLSHGDRLGKCPDTQDRKPSTFSGCKFLDKNGNGAWDSGEPTIPGWKIDLKKNDEIVMSEITGLDGCYSFEGVMPGTYTISEAQVEGYRQTFPENGSYQISCGFNDDRNHLDFGNKQTEHTITCENPLILNFENDSSKNSILQGQVIDSEYSSQGVEISAKNFNPSHPQKAIIFDSNNPSGNINGDGIKDIDLGTPNKMFGGPGDSETGNGFEPSNFKPLNNFLILPDNDVDTNPSDGYVDDPNDEPAGGEFTFTFSRLFTFDSAQYIDLDHSTGEVRGFSDASGTAQVFSVVVPQKNGNSVQTVIGDATTQIQNLKLKASDSYAIDNIVLCPVIICGDGLKEGGEECDLAAQNGVECNPAYGETCQFCSSECALKEKKGPFCGDAIKNGEEECDGQDGVGADKECSQDCKLVNLPFCGDGIKNGNEQCDGGSNCTQDCRFINPPFCGDGIVNGDEQCDGGENCTQDCVLKPTSGSVCGVKFFDHDGNGEKDANDENLSSWEIRISPKFSCEQGDEWADSVISSSQGKRKDNTIVLDDRSNPTSALGVAENDTVDSHFFSLGFGGNITIRFNNLIENGSGDDIQVFESTFNRSIYPLEKANVFASQDGTHWTLLGGVDSINNTTVDLGSLPWAQYIKIVDTTDKSIHSNDADGFDVDGVSAIHCQKFGESIIKTTDENGYCFENLGFAAYHVEEVLQGGWENTTPVGKQVSLSQENPKEIVDFGNKQIEEIQEGVICGFKFEDVNGDGKWQSNEGESGLGGWSIQAKNGERIYETQTSNDEENLGEYCFVGLVGGTWAISEVQQEGWIITTLETINVSISQFEGSINNNFGNFKFAKISGFKFDDLDGNGAIDSEEQKIPDWKIFMTQFGDSTSTATTTDRVGMYRFDNLGPGRYIVTEATSSEWITTSPENGQYDITVSSGGVYENNNFLNRKKEIGGEPILHPITVCKYIDETGDGKTIASTTEDMLYMAEGGWGIKVFDDTGEPIVVGSTQDGCLTFTLEDGLYKISEISKTDWVLTDAYVNQEKSQFQKDSFFDVFVNLEITSTTTATSTVDFFNRNTRGSSNGGDNDDNGDGETNPTPPQGGPTGGTGGGGGGILGLIIHTENAFDTSLGGTYSARVIWFTNHSATSRVVYDTISHPQLGNAPNYGYAFSTPVYDQIPKALYHSILIEGLSANTIYYFRPISAASPERWGKELAVSVGISSLGGGGESNPSGEAGGGGQSGDGSQTPTSEGPGQGSGEPFGIGGENPNAPKILGTEFEEDTNANANKDQGENAGINANTNNENPETKTAGEEQNQSYKFLFWILILIILAWLFFLWYNKKEDDDDDNNLKSGSGAKGAIDIDPRNILDKIE